VLGHLSLIALVLSVCLRLAAQTPATTVNSLGYLVNSVPGTGNAFNHASPANQTGNATATLKMNGLGAAAAPCVFTPKSSGKVMFRMTGLLNQNTTADGITWALAFGTGTPPANAAAAMGTIISQTPIWTALTGMLVVPFAIEGTPIGILAQGVPVWFDLQVADVTGGTASVTAIDCTANEL
jgi:hypothetical protein